MSAALRVFVALAAIMLALAGVYFARSILIPFLLAAVIAYTLSPAVAFLERRGIRRGLGALLVMAGLIVTMAGVMALMIPELIDQGRQFMDRLPGYVAAVRARIAPLESYLHERYPEQMETIRAQALEWGRRILPTVAAGLASTLQGAMTSLVRLVIWLLTIVVVPVFSYYLLADYPDIRDTMRSLVPAHLREGVGRRVAAIDRVLRAWLKGQLTVALILAAWYAIWLTVLGAPLGLLIGLIGGLANMVPYLGLVAGFIPAALLAFLDTGSWTAPLLVAAIFISGQLLESTVISPRVVGGELGLPPAVVLLAVLVGGELFGFTGLLLAVPATAAGLVLVTDMTRSYDATVRRGARAAGRPLVRRRRPGA